MKKLKKVLQKILDCLEESHIEYDQIVMSQQTADIFSTGSEDVEIVINDELPFKFFYYKKEGQPFDETQQLRFWAQTGNTTLISEKVFSQKRKDYEHKNILSDS